MADGCCGGYVEDDYPEPYPFTPPPLPPSPDSERHLMNFTFNKALGAGVGSGLLSAALPLLADLANWIQPIANQVPFLGLAVGLGTFVITWLTKANAPKSKATL